MTVDVRCWCRTCDEVILAAIAENDPMALAFRGYIACPECWNKRCPRATNHELECTRSNEPNQPGSAYQYGPKP